MNKNIKQWKNKPKLIMCAKLGETLKMMIFMLFHIHKSMCICVTLTLRRVSLVRVFHTWFCSVLFMSIYSVVCIPCYHWIQLEFDLLKWRSIKYILSNNIYNTKYKRISFEKVKFDVRFTFIFIFISFESKISNIASPYHYILSWFDYPFYYDHK